MDRIIALDLETPNSANDSICAMGIAIIDGCNVSETKYYLVNPEAPFNTMNMRIHGIAPADVKDAPSFPEIWPELDALLQGHLIVAHNALFDLSVLKKTLNHYGIETPKVGYACTKELSEHFLKLKNYKLPTICEYYGIPLKHHDAMSDANACAQIICNFLDQGMDISQYVHPYTFGKDVETNIVRSYGSHLSKTSIDLENLSDFINWLMTDDNLSDTSIRFLYKWMEDNQELQGNYPYDRIFEKLTSILQDGILDDDERQELAELFKCISDPLADCSCQESIDIVGKKIVLSGEFDFGTKDEVAQYLEANGASIKGSVSKKIDIVLVGNQGNDAWVAGNYGTKIKKALELQNSGVDIRIVLEKDFFKENC